MISENVVCSAYELIVKGNLQQELFACLFLKLGRLEKELLVYVLEAMTTSTSEVT